MKKILFAACISFLLLSCSSHPALKILSWYHPVSESNYVVPYYLNLYALAKIEKGNHLKPVRNYLEWVFDHLNYPDKYGLTGSIYDFRISGDGTEAATETYDSVDSYSATFLLLLEKYFEFSQDKAFLQKYQKQIADITYTIVYLRDENGLTSAIPNSDAKYLMDNCEVYSGLQAVMRLATSLEWKEKDLYTNIARTQKSSILSLYFNQVKQNFYWALDEAGFHNSDWNIFYPDALAQLFPIAFGLLDDRPELKKQLWEKFNALYEIKYNYPPEQQIIIKLAEKRMKL